MWYDDVFNLLPPQFRYRAVIAGGAATNFELAQDVDVFTLNFTPAEIAELITWLRVPGDLIEYPNALTPLTPNRPLAEIPASVIPHIGKPVQFIHSIAIDGFGVIETFDISTHRCFRRATVIDDPNFRGVSAHFTSPESVPRVNWDNVRDPVLTFYRYRKICLRYNLLPSADVLTQLCTMRVALTVADEQIQPAWLAYEANAPVEAAAAAPETPKQMRYIRAVETVSCK